MLQLFLANGHYRPIVLTGMVANGIQMSMARNMDWRRAKSYASSEEAFPVAKIGWRTPPKKRRETREEKAARAQRVRRYLTEQKDAG